MLKNKNWSWWYLALSIAGLVISIYLFIPYAQDTEVALCATGGGCDAVKESGFSHLFGWRHWFWSLPFWGIVFYSFLIIYNLIRLAIFERLGQLELKFKLKPDLLAIIGGFLFSIYLTGLEAFVIIAWCSFCLMQAVVAVLFFVTYCYQNLVLATKDKLRFLLEVFSFVGVLYLVWWVTIQFLSPPITLWIVGVLLLLLAGYILLHFPIFTSLVYKTVLKPIFFSFDAENVHDFMTSQGAMFSKISVLKKLLGRIYGYQPAALRQKLLDIEFRSPVGLSAGFDYNGQLTNILGQVGFGFESAGTVTFSSYEGNPKPRLGRLPKSRSLLVNKGFKSLGLSAVLSRNLNRLPADFPVGLSLGATNSPETCTPEAQVADIMRSFEAIKDREDFAYFELNISCPNVRGSGSLDQPKTLESVLSKIAKLKLKRPLFVKFPAEIEWAQARELIKIMIKYEVAAVIVSNLVKDRSNPAFDPEEMAKMTKGNFSGKPVESFSNELIKNIYREFRGQILIIGLGGIFSAEDAYRKIRLGANLTQLITGMIYGGPAAIWEINQELARLLAKDDYRNVAEAVGTEVQKGG
jgi:dihydroorotate dehydrogenase